jgi:hypothetical protein
MTTRARPTAEQQIADLEARVADHEVAFGEVANILKDRGHDAVALDLPKLRPLLEAHEERDRLAAVALGYPRAAVYGSAQVAAVEASASEAVA